MFAKILATIVLTSFVIGLAACNTVEGFGRDLSAGGSKIDRQAAEHKHY